MLLSYVAHEIAERMENLREVLGPVGLWKLIEEAYETRNDPHFGVFWQKISEVSQKFKIYWTSTEKWAHGTDCTFLQANYGVEQEKALNDIGIVTIHSSMRPFQSSMAATGLSNLTFEKLVKALDSWNLAMIMRETDPNWPKLRKIMSHIWVIVEDFLTRAQKGNLRKNSNRLSNVERLLVGVRIAPNCEGQLESLAALKKLPEKAKVDEVLHYFPRLPLVSDEFQQFPQLCALITEFGFSDLLRELAGRVQTKDSENTFLTSDKKKMREFYDFLAEYPSDKENDYSSIVASTPFLAGYGRFLAPKLAVLPGGFEDPIGRIDTLDLTYFGDRSRNFLKEILKVKTLSLDAYIREHLSDFLDANLSNKQYVALYEVFVSQKDILEKENTKKILEKLPLVRAKDGQLRPANQCYFKTEDLVKLLGDDDELWVDETVFVKSKLPLYHGFLQAIGMRLRPSLSHTLDRVETIVENPPSDVTQKAISYIFDFLLEIYDAENLAENEEKFEDEIYRMRETDWLPAKREERLDAEVWYAPRELYQPFRAKGFLTQVEVFAIPQANRKLTRDFMEFLEMPAEPDTSTVVKHLEKCIERGLEPSRGTYQILQERFKKENNLAPIERLKNQKCIYHPNRKEFFNANRFFWNKPNLPNYCFQATDWMREYKELYDFLGVAEEPSTETYLDVLIDIANEFYDVVPSLPGEISLVHARCIRILSEKLSEDPSNTSELLKPLRKEPFILTLAGTLSFVHDVATKDSDWLAEPFGKDLDTKLVNAEPETKELFDWFQIRPMSSMTRLETISLGEVKKDGDATKLIKDRSDLLGWVCVDLKRETQNRIKLALQDIKLARTDALKVRSVFQFDDIPIQSSPRQEEVAFDAENSTVYVLQNLPGSFWIPAFRVIFATLLAGESSLEIRSWAIVAATVFKAPSREDAAYELRQAGYDTPGVEDNVFEGFWEDEVGELDFGTETESNTPDWEVADEVVIDEPDSRSDKIASDTHIAAEARKKASAAKSSLTGAQDSKASKKSSAPSSDATLGLGLESKSLDIVNNEPPKKARTEWMRSYVKPENLIVGESSKRARLSRERISEIDEAAMEAVIEYERRRERVPDRQPHFNPGYDVISESAKTGERRLIEVKGLASEWTDRGVKLSRRQIIFARDNPEEIWLYVVENAVNPKMRKVITIKDFFSKADEFWFDRVWRELADEKGGDYKEQFVIGRRIQVEEYGEGKILNTKKIGLVTQLQIEFKILGTRSMTFNAARMELLED